jgi:hypothetical protein
MRQGRILFGLGAIVVFVSSVQAQSKPRACDLGIPFDGTLGRSWARTGSRCRLSPGSPEIRGEPPGASERMVGDTGFEPVTSTVCRKHPKNVKRRK